MRTAAIIGTGISGMAAAYFLKDHFEITFYEKNSYAGGHTNTLTIDEDGADIFIDSAFMVYNEITYPLLTRFFRELDVPTQPTDMSFSVQHLAGSLEYAGDGWGGLFAQKRNLIRPGYWKMLLDIDRFNRRSVSLLEDPSRADESLMDYVRREKFGDDFVWKFLLPMSSAVWSAPPDKMLRFPAVTLIRFFKNHGFLGGLSGHYQWRTVSGGSRVYRDRLMKIIGARLLLNNAAVELRRSSSKAYVTDVRGETREFDHVICAGHADAMLSILKDATVEERNLLGCFPYQPNRATLHTDDAVMPRSRRAWAAWNYRINSRGDTSTVYWMNRLQNVSQRRNYFISINESGEVDRRKIMWQTEYRHPLFDVAGARAQGALKGLNGKSPVSFCGAYFRYGFHEDGFMSGLDAARTILRRDIWSDAA